MKKSNKAARRGISQSRQATRSLPCSALSVVTGGQGDKPQPGDDSLVGGVGDDKPPIIP